MTAVCLPPRSGAGIEDYQRSVFEQQPSVPTSWPLITNRVGGAQEKEFTSNSRGPPILNKSSVTLKIYGLRQLATFDRSFADTASATPSSAMTQTPVRCRNRRPRILQLIADALAALNSRR